MARVALVHDFLMQYGGAERVLECLHDMYPSAPVYTLMADLAALPEKYQSWDIRPVPFLQRSKAMRANYKSLFPIYPRFIDQLDLQAFDLVVSSSYAYAHGVRVADRACHISYCHTPMRFVWFQEEEYRNKIPAFAAPAYNLAIRSLRQWDLIAAKRPYHYVANCRRMAQRIEKVYGRTASVVHPPVMLPAFAPSISPTGDYYLVVARLVHPYKRVDLAIEAFARLGLPLKIAGDGADRAFFERMAGEQVEFLGHLNDAKMADAYANCKALVMPWDEDFGIAAIEANAYGKPVIGYRQSGLSESQVEGLTAVFFDELTSESLAAAVQDCAIRHWDSSAIQHAARRFTPEAFAQGMSQTITRCLTEFESTQTPLAA